MILRETLGFESALNRRARGHPVAMVEHARECGGIPTFSTSIQRAMVKVGSRRSCRYRPLPTARAAAVCARSDRSRAQPTDCGTFFFIAPRAPLNRPPTDKPYGRDGYAPHAPSRTTINTCERLQFSERANGSSRAARVEPPDAFARYRRGWPAFQSQHAARSVMSDGTRPFGLILR